MRTIVEGKGNHHEQVSLCRAMRLDVQDNVNDAVD